MQTKMEMRIDAFAALESKRETLPERFRRACCSSANRVCASHWLSITASSRCICRSCSYSVAHLQHRCFNLFCVRRCLKAHREGSNTWFRGHTWEYDTLQIESAHKTQDPQRSRHVSLILSSWHGLWQFSKCRSVQEVGEFQKRRRENQISWCPENYNFPQMKLGVAFRSSSVKGQTARARSLG